MVRLDQLDQLVNKEFKGFKDCKEISDQRVNKEFKVILDRSVNKEFKVAKV